VLEPIGTTHCRSGHDSVYISDSSVRRVVTKLLVAEDQAVETGALRAVWATSRPELAEMQIRIGVNTGEVVSGKHWLGDPYGTTPSWAII
jgi:hypothetical protein